MNKDIERALGPLAAVYDDPEVSRIFADGPGAVYCSRKDEMEDLSLPHLDGPALITVIKELFRTVERQLDGSEGFASCRLADGTMVRAVFPPIALGGPALTLEKLPARPPDWDGLRKEGFVDEAGQRLLDAILLSGASTLLSGLPGAGRTTFASLMLNRVPRDRRVVLVEGQAAMMPESFRGLRLEADDAHGMPLPELVDVACELAPDLLFVHEMEGGEAKRLVEIMRSGRSVMAVTGASSVGDALRRLELLLLRRDGLGLPIAEIRAMICDGLRYVTFQRRLEGGRRILEEVTRIDGLDGDRFRLTLLYHHDGDGGDFVLSDAGRAMVARP